MISLVVDISSTKAPLVKTTPVMTKDTFYVGQCICQHPNLPAKQEMGIITTDSTICCAAQMRPGQNDANTADVVDPYEP